MPENGKLDSLRCVVERITFQNEENGFSVLKCKVKGYHDLVTVVGNLLRIYVGAVLNVQGQWQVDSRYGRQFSVERWEEVLPATAYGIEKYLGSGLVRGIGPKMAKRIVQRFGKDTLDVIETDPERLEEVSGIGKKRVAQIRQGWEEQKEVRNIMLFLQEHDVSTGHAAKIFRNYGSESISVIRENPYRLADDIWGIGFRTADTIASKLGVEKNSLIRLRSGILYTLNQLSDQGHCFAYREQLIQEAETLLEVDAADLEKTLDSMLGSTDVVVDGEAIYLPAFYYSESGCAVLLSRLIQAERQKRIPAEQVLRQVSEQASIQYDQVQLDAIRQAVTSKVMVLTGGPGTGKTTTTLGIISAYRMAGCKILLAAPTGRAAKRMSETTGMEAKTIHRLLEYKPPEGYQRNRDNLLQADVLILDECSMIDIILMYHLLQALPESMTLILVGDVDQLPSVGAGNVLKDIISSQCVPVVRLQRIFRQAQDSRIIMNAHRINQGEMPDLRGGRDSDFFFAARKTGEEIAELLVQYCTENLPRYYHADPLRDIQVLSPMQRGFCGAANLNRLLQNAMNPAGCALTHGGTQFRVRDKVMQIRNNYEKEVFNGDIGVIVRVDSEERTLTVNFDGRDVSYEVLELDELVLAYATTIHKAQGSEYPIVVLPFSMSHYVMLQRNLLYTAVTRAKKALILIGEKKAVYCAVKNEKTAARNTRLAERLRENEKPKSPVPAARPEFSLGNPDNLREQGKNPYHDVMIRLERSKFRTGFSLKERDRDYIREKGMNTIRTHASDLISRRLSPASIPNDGKQTPMEGHPVFVAQHATATCCRGCLEKWYGIPKGIPLTTEQQETIVDVIMEWIQKQMKETSEN